MPEPTAPSPKSGESDAMKCRACGREERASEGYPCFGCGTFICIICTFRGVTLCRDCEAKGVVVPPPPPPASPPPPA
jgi:hypothetical protein